MNETKINVMINLYIVISMLKKLLSTARSTDTFKGIYQENKEKQKVVADKKNAYKQNSCNSTDVEN